MPELRVGIVGGSGYAGGELLRLLLRHPSVQITQVTSESQHGRYLHQRHPNLRGHTDLRFCSLAQLDRADVLFCALPHGQTRQRIDSLSSLAAKVIDLSADFRIGDRELARRYYPDLEDSPWSERFIYALPELNRAGLRVASHAAGPGCLATAALLGLYPLAAGGLLTGPVVIEAKVGSTAAGASPGPGSHHPERRDVVRSYAPTGHRHEAELIEQLRAAALEGPGAPGPGDIHFSATAVELVRGVLVTAHVFPSEEVSEGDLWRLYREHYTDEPFIQIVKQRTGIYRYPEPKILAGTNRCEVGFEVDADSGRIVIMSALDNLVKGAAGNAVQVMNVMSGFPEATGLDLVAVHP